MSVKKFRDTIDKIEDTRASTMIKTAYLLAARNSEILTECAPWDLMHGASKPYGQFLKFTFQNFEEQPATEKTEEKQQKVFVITSAVAKRGKQLKSLKRKQKEPAELNRAEVIEALTKWGQTDLLDKWQAGERVIDPILIKMLLGKIRLKVVALPTSLEFEPWTMDLLKWIQKHGNINFNMTRQRFWQIIREALPSLLPRKGVHSIKNPLRHYRISHLVEYYKFDPYEITSYTGWTTKSTFGQLGIQASPNLDVYAHLRWRLYFPKLLRPMDQFK